MNRLRRLWFHGNIERFVSVWQAGIMPSSKSLHEDRRKETRLEVQFWSLVSKREHLSKIFIRRQEKHSLKNTVSPCRNAVSPHKITVTFMIDCNYDSRGNGGLRQSKLVPLKLWAEKDKNQCILERQPWKNEKGIQTPEVWARVHSASRHSTIVPCALTALWHWQCLWWP